MAEEKAKSDNPAVQEAMDDRDALLDDIKTAVAKVDRLVAEYAEVEKARR